MYLRRRRRDWISRIKQRVIRCRPYASCVSAVRERVQRTSPLQSLRREEASWQRNETENRDAYIVAIGQVMQRLAITKMMLEEHHPRHLLDVAIINFCIPFRVYQIERIPTSRSRSIFEVQFGRVEIDFYKSNRERMILLRCLRI